MQRLSLAVFSLLFIFSWESSAEDQEKRQFRALQLPNQMRVLLIADPQIVKSAAALSVGVGSDADPKDSGGAFHYLEHMLFLGTKSFPREGEYQQFIEASGGGMNAYTASDITNYMFEVNHSALPEALHRMSRFFVEPLFSPEFAEREKKNVDSEWGNDKDSDDWRLIQTLLPLMNPAHPGSRFSPGTLETLRSLTAESARALFESHYSANLMALVIISPQSLDQMEPLARQYFGDVANKNYSRVRPLVPPLPEDHVTTRHSMKTISGKQEITLQFYIPATLDQFRQRPLKLAARILNDPRGLTAQLKDQGLATKVSAGLQEAIDHSVFFFSADVTDLGLREQDRVVDALWGSIKGLAQTEVPEHVFKDWRELAELRFWGNTDSAFEQVSTWAQKLQEIPDLSAFPIDAVVPSHYDPQVFKAALAELKPNRVIVLAIGPDLEPGRIEPHTGARYDQSRDPALQARLMTSPALPVFLPPANPFLPTSEVKLPAGGARVQVSPVYQRSVPMLLLRRPYGEIWGQQDLHLHTVNTQVDLHWHTVGINSSAKKRVLAMLYVDALNDFLNQEFTDQLSAGLQFGVELKDGKESTLVIEVAGLSNQVPIFLPALGKAIASFQPSVGRVGLLRERLLALLEGWHLEQEPYVQAMEHLNRRLGRIPYTARQLADALKRISPAEVTPLARDFYKRGWLQGVVYGSFEKAPFRNALAAMTTHLRFGADPRGRALLPRLEPIQRPGQETLDLVLERPTSAAVWYGQVGPATPRNVAMTMLYSQFYSSHMYNDLRTLQNLGYSVMGGARENKGLISLLGLIQSNEHPASHLAERIVEYMPRGLEAFAQLSPEAFMELKQGVIEDLAGGPSSLEIATAQLLFQTSWPLQTPDRLENLLQVLESLSQEEVVEFVRLRLLNPHHQHVRVVTATGSNHVGGAAVDPCGSILNPK